jgi:hypothetical protein
MRWELLGTSRKLQDVDFSVRTKMLLCQRFLNRNTPLINSLISAKLQSKCNDLAIALHGRKYSTERKHLVKNPVKCRIVQL